MKNAVPFQLAGCSRHYVGTVESGGGGQGDYRGGDWPSRIRHTFCPRYAGGYAAQNFSELVRISGFSHGTNVWLNNARDLITSGKVKLEEAISTRDDIMNYLIEHHVKPLTAFKVMENVRKGKGLEKEIPTTGRNWKMPGYRSGSLTHA